MNHWLLFRKSFPRLPFAPALAALVLGLPGVLVAKPRPAGAMPPVVVSSISTGELKDFEKNPPKVRALLQAALALTTQRLGYLYGSADPALRGMDCSGTVYFLLRAAGIEDVPRSSSGQYSWVRKAGAFRAVVSFREDSFELDELQAGDLLFWTGTYSVDSDPPVSHAMIYLGKALSDGRALMVGASDGRTFRGQKHYGVSVFDFRIPQPTGPNPGSRFIGYAKIPGLEP